MLLHPYILLTDNKKMKIAVVGAHAGVGIYVTIVFWVQTIAWEPCLNPLLFLLTFNE